MSIFYLPQTGQSIDVVVERRSRFHIRNERLGEHLESARELVAEIVALLELLFALNVTHHGGCARVHLEIQARQEIVESRPTSSTTG